MCILAYVFAKAHMGQPNDSWPSVWIGHLDESQSILLGVNKIATKSFKSVSITIRALYNYH
jgi:hypothetical protein